MSNAGRCQGGSGQPFLLTIRCCYVDVLLVWCSDLTVELIIQIGHLCARELILEVDVLFVLDNVWQMSTLYCDSLCSCCIFKRIVVTFPPRLSIIMSYVLCACTSSTFCKTLTCVCMEILLGTTTEVVSMYAVSQNPLSWTFRHSKYICCYDLSRDLIQKPCCMCRKNPSPIWPVMRLVDR